MYITYVGEGNRGGEEVWLGMVKQCGFMLKNSTSDVMLALRVLVDQESALNPSLFAVVSLWTKMLAYNIVICIKTSEQVEENLERWGIHVCE